jgi:RimJ/RimL family protein N-acetyltransferase
MKNPISVGKRIYFRPLEIDDIDKGWQKWINDENSSEFLDGIFPVSRESLIKYYSDNQPPNSVIFSICDKSNDKYFGNAKLGSIDWVNRRCTYGRLIGLEEYKNKGFGTEALVLLIKYGFLKLGMNRIYSGAIKDNIASLKSNEKVGFVKEGIQRNAIWRNGKFNDIISLAITKEDFEKKYGKDL